MGRGANSNAKCIKEYIVPTTEPERGTRKGKREKEGILSTQHVHEQQEHEGGSAVCGNGRGRLRGAWTAWLSLPATDGVEGTEASKLTEVGSEGKLAPRTRRRRKG